ncbi:MAG: TraB/GumN family protein [Muribaculaceae bacterium]|nr:TraB/GumN family protein [Muribaculaceae bacterium]
MRKIFFAVLFLAATIATNAQLLWKIDGNGAKQPSYVFGTHHLAPVSLIDSVAGLKDAIKASKIYYGELDMSNFDMQKLQVMTMQKIYLPEDSTWNVIFTPQELAFIDSIIPSQAPMPPTTKRLERISPAFFDAQYAIQRAMQCLPDFDINKQLDKTIFSIANEQGIESRGFETNEFQLEVAYGAPLRQQAEELLADLRNPDADSEIKEMCDIYMRQDYPALEKFTEKVREGEVFQRASERLIYSRNENWADQLKAVLPEGGVFIAVGAGHLPGKRGLLNLLREQGYTVTPVE